jgi:transposase-like protein
MTDDDLTFLPLRVTRVGVGGKRSFDPMGKQRLVDACLRPGASLSGLALKAGECQPVAQMGSAARTVKCAREGRRHGRAVVGFRTGGCDW